MQSSAWTSRWISAFTFAVLNIDFFSLYFCIKYFISQHRSCNQRFRLGIAFWCQNNLVPSVIVLCFKTVLNFWVNENISENVNALIFLNQSGLFVLFEGLIEFPVHCVEPDRTNGLYQSERRMEMGMDRNTRGWKWITYISIKSATPLQPKQGSSQPD